MSWQEDLLNQAAGSAARGLESERFEAVLAAARALGFEYVAYGYQAAWPLNKPQVGLVSNYPLAWQERYAAAQYLESDPTVHHGRQSQDPLVWRDALFTETPQLWQEARDHGLRVGWAQSCVDGCGGGMLTVARSCEPLTPCELLGKEHQMRWLVQLAHLTLARGYRQAQALPADLLTGREIEILKWTADGKSAQDIADILNISKNTVDFHIKNSVLKLRVANKTAAVVRAALSGLLG